MSNISVLVLGASYGLLVASRLAQAGVLVTVVCTPEEQQDLICNGAQVDFINNSDEIKFKLQLPVTSGQSTKVGCIGVVGCETSLDRFSMVFLAFSEPQCAMPKPNSLLVRIAQAGLPVVSLMNCLVPTFLRRLNGLPVEAVEPAYYATPIWRLFNHLNFTASSPDAQAFRPEVSSCRLKVGLWSNFKVAPFSNNQHQAVLASLASSVQSVRVDGKRMPVDLVVHNSLTVPLAKWPMLLSGNCRCILPGDGVISIAEAVWHDLALSEEIYKQVCKMVLACGADGADLIPFRVYATVARSLKTPSSMARAVQNKVQRVERVDKVIQLLGKAMGCASAETDFIVTTIDRRLAN